MDDQEEVVQNLTNHYIVKVMRAFGGKVDPASKAISEIAKCVKDIYRYFEPSFFKGDFYVFNKFDNNYCFDERKGSLIYDKNIFLNRTTGKIIIQSFEENTRLYLWEDENIEDLLTQEDILVYHFKDNKECFYANGNKIDITIYDKGSRFATQFNDLVLALQKYSVNKIYQSSCNHFSNAWAEPKQKRLFFKGGGSGSNIPEKFMQNSLHEFMDSYFIRGIKMESSREYNTIGDFTKPKPVDVKIHWREANRTALIEVKFIGTIKKDSDNDIYNYKKEKVNKGIGQLKEYFDATKRDSPTTILKSYLVVIDGRRNNLTKDSVTIDTENGMFYKDIELEIDEDKRFYETIIGFEKPIKMFVTPICS